MKREGMPLILKDLTPHRILVLVILFGFWIRLFFVLNSSFPLNDGGLFYVMVNQLIADDFRLPAYTSYNHAGIPYAYPFLAFYITGMLSFITHIPVLTLLQFLPLLFSTLTIPLVYIISRMLLNSSKLSLVAAFIFAVLPRSYEWMIMGGGITRSLGFVWALLAIIAGLIYSEKHENKYIWITGVCLGLAFMSHLEMSLFALYSLLLFLSYKSGVRKTVYPYGIMLLLGLAVSSLWWIPVVATHGPQVLINALHTGFWSYTAFLPLLLFNFTQEPFVNLLAVFTMLGVWVCLFRKQYLLPAWLALIFLISHRSGSTMATIPAALLSTVAVQHIIVPAVATLGTIRKRAIMVGAGIALIYIISLCLGIAIPATSSLRSLSEDDMRAMVWAKKNTKDRSAFLIISSLPYNAWAQDKVSEWFPAITGRKSVMTLQGLEWLPADIFNKRYALTRNVKECYTKEIGCLDKLLKKNHLKFDYLYITELKTYSQSSCCSLLLHSLQKSKKYKKVYDKNDISIWRRRS